MVLLRLPELRRIRFGVASTLFIYVWLGGCLAPAFAQQNHIDTVTPLAPELARYGPLVVGVRTIQVTDKNRPDVLRTPTGGPVAKYDRSLTIEVWYPATLKMGQKPGGEYRVMTREPAVVATLYGRAVRDATAEAKGAPFPLVILSHGYPGNRFLLSHLGENLASKGFVVVSIDHKESTYNDRQAFSSTLYNRPLDQLFVLNEMARLGRSDSGSFLTGVVDADHTGLVGYSMGGYGVISVAGGGFSKKAESFGNAPPNQMLMERSAANPAYQKALDSRVVAAVAIAPWGMNHGFWDREGLKGLRIPMLYVAGSLDSIAGYENGTRAIYQATVNSDRYLLTFVNGSHNVAGPIPPPVEILTFADSKEPSPFLHYADPVWDSVRSNNILQHFVTAFLGLALKKQPEMKAYLDVPSGTQRGNWKGFKEGTTGGLILEHSVPAP
jgi:predicted dienelactone hydrolase